MSPRPTLTSNVVPRTAAATAERRRRHVRALVERFVWVIDELPDDVLDAVIGALVEERESRAHSATGRRNGIAQARAQFGRTVAEFGTPCAEFETDASVSRSRTSVCEAQL
jgi:hypothetical protein